MDVLDHIAEEIGQFKERIDDASQAFYSFEPWDVEERAEWMFREAISDGVDLKQSWMRPHLQTPHTFQSGIVLSQATHISVCGATQIGKSLPSLIKGVIMTSGEKPISLRYDRGVDTGIPRAVTRENVRRFGRRDAITGEIIDYRENVRPQSEWNCGTIIGAGVFPDEMILDPGDAWWICTLQKAMLNYWWPRFFNPEKMVVPAHMIDKSKNGGYNVTDRIAYLPRGCRAQCITYEAGFDKVEAETAGLLFLDEEPMKQSIHQAALQHARWLMLIETPYRGITWTRPIIFPDPESCDDEQQAEKEKAILDDPNYETYHATQYDCPYKPRKEVDTKKRAMERWDFAPRVYGIPSDATGRPYFDRLKINMWRSRFSHHYELMTFKPQTKWHGIKTEEWSSRPGLMDVKVHAVQQPDDNRLNTWRIYEEVMPQTAYVLCVDPADGAETPEDAADVAAALMFREPKEGEEYPMIVASLRSTQQVIPFSNTCLLACRYYNNALLAAETKRGTANGAFWSHCMDYPYWFKMVTMNDKTGEAKEHKGFDPTAKTRPQIYEFIRERINAYEDSADPRLRDDPLLKELEEAIVGKNGRCDHTKRGTLDTTTCLGIGRYVFKIHPEQVVCNEDEEEEREKVDSFFSRVLKEKIDKQKRSEYLGGNMPSLR